MLVEACSVFVRVSIASTDVEHTVIDSYVGEFIIWVLIIISCATTHKMLR
jgi:hypothetical protein